MAQYKSLLVATGFSESSYEIFKHIEDKGSDLLVIGDSGHSKFVRLMLGSTSEKIIRKAPCSVMTVRNCKDKG